MSIQNSDFTSASSAVARSRPVVLRFKAMFPEALGRYEMHAERRGGDLSQVDPDKTPKNALLIGDADWRRRLQEQINLARAANLVAELEALKRRKRLKDREKRMLEGATMPWKASAEGPLREVILTAHRDWFAEKTDMDRVLGETRTDVFERHAVKWLKSRFGDAVVHARADHDEMTFHIHAIVAPWTEKASARRGEQRTLQPSSIPILQDYEKAQDDVGEYFGQIGLERGKRTKAARREAIAARAEREALRAALKLAGRPVPDELASAADPVVPTMREHVPTPIWWAEETRRLADRAASVAADRARVAQADQQAREREARAATREQDAEEAIDLIEGFADGRQPPKRLPTGSLGARLVGALRNLGLKMRADAEAKAQRDLAEEVKAVASYRDAVAALKDRIVAVLPMQVRARFARETDAAEKAAQAAAERLEQLGKRRPEERK